MGNSKSFWKETIGVVPTAKPAGSPPIPAATPSPLPTPPQTPPAAKSRSPEREATGPTEPTGPTGPVSPENQPTGPASSRADRQNPFSGPLPGSNLLEQVIDRLPYGTLVFSDEVGRKLWADPTPDDLRNLTLLHDNKARLYGSSKETVLNAVMIRLRSTRLTALASQPVLDSPTLQARSAEYSRLASVARETAKKLDLLPERDQNPAVSAAKTLSPNHLDLEAEAALAAECGALVEVAMGKRRWEFPEFRAFPEAVDLLGAIASGQPRPLDDLFLQVLAGFTLSRRATAMPRETQERLRRALRLLNGRLEGMIVQAMRDHRRDQARAQRLANWRRTLAESRNLLHETMTAPGSRGGTASSGAEEALTAPLPPEEGLPLEGSILNHLRRVRERAQQAGQGDSAPAGPAPQPNGTGEAEPGPKGQPPGWRRWFSR